MPGPGLAGPGHRRGFPAATTPGHRGCVECPDCLAEGVGQERRAGGCYGAGRIRRDHAQTYFELSPPHPTIAPTRSAKTPRPITMPVPPAFITVPVALDDLWAADTRTNATRDHPAGTPIVSS